MPSISFPQYLAISKGGNYVLNEKFNGFNPLAPNITMQAFPSIAKFVPDIHNTAAQTYSLATSTTQEPAGNFVFSSGGNIATVTSMSVYGFPDMVQIPKTGAPNYYFVQKAGDWLWIRANSNHTNTGEIFREGTSIALQPILSSTVSNGPRSLLVASFVGVNTGLEQFTNQSQAQGTIIPNANQNQTLEFLGRVSTLPNNNLGDYRVLVGFFREHGNPSQGLPAHPTEPPDGPVCTMHSDFVAAFQPYLIGSVWNGTHWIGGSFRWCAVLFGQNLDLDQIKVFIIPTSVAAHQTANLRLTWINRTITWYANGTQIAQQDLSLLDSSMTLTFNVHVGCGIREVKAVDSTIPISDFSEFTNRLIVDSMVLTPDPFEVSTATTINTSETSYHNTGVQLLKKLK